MSDFRVEKGGSSGGTPGGTDTQVQFNDASAFGGDAGLTYNKTTNALLITSGTISVPGSGLSSEAFGSGATATSASATAVGNSAVASGGAGKTVAVGKGATCTASRSIAIGEAASVVGVDSVGIGQAVNVTALGTQSVAIGSSAASIADACVAIGHTASCSEIDSIAIGMNCVNGIANSFQAGSGTHPINNLYFGKGDANAVPTAYTINGTGGSGTNIAGGSIQIAGGKGTGSSAAGDVVSQTSNILASGAAPQTLGDRIRVLGKYTTLTESAATAFARVNVPSGTVAGGNIIYTIEANDGTDFQALTGVLFWAAVNKAGVTTVTVTDPAGNITTATSSVSTLTNTMTAVDATLGNVDFKANAISSLVQTTLRINCQVIKNFGTGAISAV